MASHFFACGCAIYYSMFGRREIMGVRVCDAHQAAISTAELQELDARREVVMGSIADLIRKAPLLPFEEVSGTGVPFA